MNIFIGVLFGFMVFFCNFYFYFIGVIATKKKTKEQPSKKDIYFRRASIILWSVTTILFGCFVLQGWWLLLFLTLPIVVIAIEVYFVFVELKNKKEKRNVKDWDTKKIGKLWL
ncbi:MAG: hypothetical protein GY679_01225 [Mycoplasma sp.]|nr:hypothetical protein [Mycoplasma sp.]